MRRKKCNAKLTRSLYVERKRLIEELAIAKKSLVILTEGASRHQSLDTKIEFMQLNEVLYPYFLSNKAMGNDLYKRIVRQTIAELKESGLIELDSPLLTEGFWDSVQAGIGNFAGGIDKVLKKIKLKKEPKGWEEAQRIFTKVAEKEGNQVVRDLVDAIEAETTSTESGLGSKPKDSKFPVNKNKEVFFSGVNTIASTYDTVVAATEKEPGSDGYMPVEVANEIIEQLRIIVQKYMADTEREKGGMYATVGGGDSGRGKEVQTFEGEDDEEVLTEQDDEEPKEGEDQGQEIDPDEEYEKIMRGQASPVFQRMTSLKAPVVIAGVGAALGAMGWVANQPWFQDWVLDILDISKTTTTTTPSREVFDTWSETMTDVNPEIENLGQIKAGGGGLAQQTSRLLGLDSGTNLMGRDASIGDLRDAALKAGGGDLDQGLKNIAALTQGRGNPDAAYGWMKKAIETPDVVGVEDVDTEGSLWKLFAGGTERGGGVASRANFPGKDVFSVGIGNKLKQTILKQTTRVVTKSVPRKIAGKVVKTGTASAAGAVAMMTGAAPVLAGIGLSTVVAGAALAAIRQRGKTKSRMGTLNSLLQQLKTLPPAAAPGVEIPEDEESVVTITLHDADEGVKTESWKTFMPVLSERTEVEITGLSGTEELEKTGGIARFTLDPVSNDVFPKVTKASEIPFVIQGIEDMLPDFDLGADNVAVKIIDKRTKPDIPEGPPEEETPPVPVEPAQIAKGDNAVVVFDPDAVKVFRILKKVTFKAYADDARRSGDKDAPEFADRHARYDAILAKLKADGVFVNSDGLEAELSKISSGKDGSEYRVSYTRTRKGKKRKSTTGGYTDAGKVGSISDIRSNILGAPGSRPPRGRAGMTVIYLIGNNTLRALKSAGLSDEKAKAVANSAIAKWANSGKRPKLADLGVEDKEVATALRSASLAEALGYKSRRRYAVVEVTPKFFKKVLSEIKLPVEKDRWSVLAGI